MNRDRESSADYALLRRSNSNNRGCIATARAGKSRIASTEQRPRPSKHRDAESSAEVTEHASRPCISMAIATARRSADCASRRRSNGSDVACIATASSTFATITLPSPLFTPTNAPLVLGLGPNPWIRFRSRLYQAQAALLHEKILVLANRF